MNDTQTTAPALTITRTFKAPRERVFAAFTDADLIQKWFGPPGTNVSAVTLDARTGGRIRVLMKNSEGEDFNARGVIAEFRAPERLSYTFAWEEDDPKDEHETFITVDFIERGNQTEIVFTQERFASEESRDNHIKGWNGSFGKLDALL
jgi:uncharacterized protein YndB with AHSA1/START domain